MIIYDQYLVILLHVVSDLWPSFLLSGSASGQRRVLDINLVDHFVSAQHDGSMITWLHAANSRDRLKQALMSMFTFQH